VGVARTIDTRRDFYPLSEAARIAHALTESEKGAPEDKRWSYLIEAKPENPDLAAVKVVDENSEFVGWWYR
jgi:hypothetical protein